MRTMRRAARAAAFTGAALLAAAPALAQEKAYPEPQRGTYVIADFAFEDGGTLPEMTVGYMTIGDPANPAVLITHGTTSAADSMLGDAFAGNLYGPGQPLDAEKYFLILVDAIGAGA